MKFIEVMETISLFLLEEEKVKRFCEMIVGNINAPIEACKGTYTLDNITRNISRILLEY